MTWHETTLGDVLPFKYGKGLPAHSRDGNGEIQVVSSAGPSGRHSVAFTTGPTVVIGRKGTIGSTYFCPRPVWPIDTTFYVEPSPQIDIRFAYYLLQTLPLREMNSDSAVPGLNRRHAEALPVLIPEVDEQREIAATLASFDDKIESNHRLIALVPRLVRARVERELSAGATDIAVASLGRFINGGAYTKGATGSGRMVVRIAELNSGPSNTTVYNELDVPEDKTARAGDLLMSWSGSLGVYRWTRDEAIINQHIFKVIPSEYPAWLVYDRLDAVMDTFRGYAADKATTMGHIKRGDLVSTHASLPSPEALERLDVDLSPLWERLLVAEQENIRLEALRDALLPELLSGRIRVPAVPREAS